MLVNTPKWVNKTADVSLLYAVLPKASIFISLRYGKLFKIIFGEAVS